MADYKAGSGWKCDWWSEISSMTPQDTSTYCDWHPIIITSKEISFWKNYFLCFSPKMAYEAILGEKYKKRIFSKNNFFWCGNYVVSTTVCGGILRGNRRHFRTPITFPGTPGHIIGHIAACQKIAKSRFWPKFQISILWPGVSENVIYGRKWVPEVF